VTQATFDGVARRILRRRPRLGSTRLVAVDGPSGAGKTVFAERLAVSVAAGAGGVPVPVVHTDDFLDGWDDQFTYWDRLDELLLAPLRAGRAGRHRRYDWERGAFVGPWVAVPPAPVVILEGFGAARAGSELTFTVFVTAPPRLRLARSLARDGAATRPYLLRWRRRENRHFAADRTAERADLVVSGVWSGEPVVLSER
jgi:uridine kinase